MNTVYIGSAGFQQHNLLEKISLKLQPISVSENPIYILIICHKSS